MEGQAQGTAVRSLAANTPLPLHPAPPRHNSVCACMQTQHKVQLDERDRCEVLPA